MRGYAKKWANKQSCKPTEHNSFKKKKSHKKWKMLLVRELTIKRNVSFSVRSVLAYCIPASEERPSKADNNYFLTKCEETYLCPSLNPYFGMAK